MPLHRIVLRELTHHRWNSLAGLCAVMLAVSAIAGTRMLLTTYDDRTRGALEAKRSELQSSLAALEGDIGKAMGELGFNLRILPERQDLADWYAQDQATATMPEAYVDRLVRSGTITVRYPVAQLRRLLQWPETQWTIVLVGRAVVKENGEEKGGPSPEVAARHLEAIPPGEVTLGHELHRVLGFREGDTIRLLGRAMRVRKCLPREGNKDDIAVWMDLHDAQQLLGQPGQINEIVALGCSTAPGDFADVRAAIARVLPGTQVVEQTPHVLAAAQAAMDVKKNEEARLQQERLAQQLLQRQRRKLAGLVSTLVIASCGLWIGWLAAGNAVQRRVEIGIWRACGLRAGRLAMMFVGRWVALGAVGGAGGFAAAILVASGGGGSRFADPVLWGWTLSVAVGLSATASVAAVLIVAREDPAMALRGNP
jgi:hypothetical protein